VSSIDILVLAGAVTAIAWVNWYFFVAGRSAPAAVRAASGSTTAGAVVITVDGGYSPAVVRGKVGTPLRLIFDRVDDSSCSEEIVMPDFGVRRFLPSGEQTPIEITPTAPGRYQFTCGMGMLRGAVVVDA
jgi:plastocyanin domain-containing protein